ncbi:MAG TPA: zinc ABC transporter substrate-binding protein [Syntrophorhabdaceae bacterium]|nr:zinc ABC transporter substrate-binding protein [Syntrophorhabdaceae bacterium]
MKQKTYGFLLAFLFIFILGIYFSGCGKTEQKSQTHRIKIITTLFPLYDFTKNLAKDRADVTLILPPGVEPHSFEPRAGDILKINSAHMLIYTGKFMEPWVEDIIKGIDNKGLLIVDSSIGIKLLTHKFHTHQHQKEHGHVKYKKQVDMDADPHIWLDLANAQLMVDNILAGLVKKDPVNRDFYEKNAQEYKTKLMELDKRFSTNLASCKKRIIVHGGHFAFGYLARRYNLQYISAYKGSPDAEPTLRHVAHMKKIIKDNDIKYIFFEELIMPRLAEVLAKETGAEILMLHGCHNIARDEMNRGVTFISLMEKNLENLSKGLECP